LLACQSACGSVDDDADARLSHCSEFPDSPQIGV
jgi:hypothetical protein